MALTGKQKAFVDAYLETMNATKAAKKAGYSEKTAYSIGWENLRKPEILAEIAERLNSRAMGKPEILHRLSEHARADLGEFLKLPIEDIAEHPQSYLLKKVKRTVRRQRDGEEIETVEFELHDPQAALNTLLKQWQIDNGNPTERTDITTAGEKLNHSDPRALTDDQLIALIERLAKG